ncbi:hypothetical protein ACEPAG_3467 [Sanghuangporus baumii]
MSPRKHTTRLSLGRVFIALLSAGLLVQVIDAHPEEFSGRVSRAELVRREHLANKRHLAARGCASSINDFHVSRRAKRSFSEQFPFSGDGLRESTCVTAPEIEEGPYYVNNELVRTDLVEDQEGVVILLDVGVIDTATCEPVPNAIVEIWSANATGFYGSFDTKTNGRPPPRRGPGSYPGGPDDDDLEGPSDDHDHPHQPSPLGPPPNRHPLGLPGGPGDSPGRRRGGPGRGSPSMTTNNTWLRGGYPTDSTGTVSLCTLYPGFYPGRTIHIHTMVHTDWSQSPNGTLISHSGSLNHIGQMFFDEEWNDRILEREPYSLNEARRTRNDEDHDFRRASVDRSSAIVEVEMLGDSLDQGLIGFITIGIDMTADYSIHSGNYYNSSSEAESYSNVVDVDM